MTKTGYSQVDKCLIIELAQYLARDPMFCSD